MMMDPSEAGDSSTPFADVTNTTNQGSHLHFEVLKRLIIFLWCNLDELWLF
jgi:hypothetical protein